jgi:hypothetical protein
MGKKIISIFLIVLMISSISVISFADSVVSISLTEAVNKAIDTTDSIDDLDDQMEDIWEQHNDMLQVKHQMEDMLTALSRYEDLYDKKYVDKEALTPMEEGTLMKYQKMFGETPPKYSGQEMFEQFIRNRDFPHYQLWVAYEQMRNNKEMIPIMLESNVKELYVNILNLKDILVSQNDYTNTLKEKYEAAELKYELGQISAFELLNEKTNFLIQKLNNEKIENQLIVLELNFKKLIGIELNSQIKLTSKLFDFRNIELEDISYYESQAITNRMEVIIAKLNYEMESREADIADDYLLNPLLTDRLIYDSDKIDAKNELEEAILDVREDVTKAYFAVEESHEDYNLKVDDYFKATIDLNSKRVMYEMGMIDKNTFSMIEFAHGMAKNSLISASRILKLNYEKLENASSFGPGFESNMGGY